MDHLDDELRALLHSDRLDVAVRSDADEIIVAGARRVRRRRIVAATASGALGVVVVVVAAFLTAGGAPDAMPPATSTTTRPPAAPSIEVETLLPSAATAQAPPLGTTTTTTTRPKPPRTPTKTTDPGPPDLNYLVIGPTGLRSVRLGQTLEDAQATGMLGSVTTHTSGGCDIYQLISDDRVTGSVRISDTVRSISANPVQTPQGVGPGWTLSQVEEVYPDVDTQAATETGEARVPVPGNAAAVFRLLISGGKVTGVALELADATC
ncbi:hypothetical protein [Actinophytocola sp.]|uniref:hypothetical protein n=1 Tax=Actinophytocola sp. TaxID=1872138 RepID=UPI00389A5585